MVRVAGNLVSVHCGMVFVGFSVDIMGSRRCLGGENDFFSLMCVLRRTRKLTYSG